MNGLVALALVASGCERPEVRAAGGAASARFVDVARQLGIHFHHASGKSGRLYLPETMGGGCAFLDYDGDGRLDLCFVNSSRLPGFKGKGPFYPALYHQRPDPGTGPHRPTPTAGVGAPPSAPPAFEDVTKRAGLAIDIYGMGCAVGDYDNDGHPDLYLTALGPNHLFHNNGDGTFSDVTKRAGVGDPRWSTSAAWLDYDRDGRLDLLVGNYSRWSPALNVVCHSASGPQMCAPNHYRGDSSTLYHNNGDGIFTDVTRKAGIYSEVGKALGVVVWDFDDDGWPDFMIANDMEPNLLYRNNHDGSFREVGVEAGVAYSMAGKARSGMGIDSGDVENDGREAIVIGDNSREGLALFRPEPMPLPSPEGGAGGGEGTARFADTAEGAGLFQPSFFYLTFGTMFCDVDLDGRKDIVTANGHVNDVIEKDGIGVTYAERMQFFHNEGGGRFVDVSRSAGPAFQDAIVGRGIAVGDYDGDGDPDLLVNVNNAPARLLRNDLPPGNHWLQVRLVGTRSNRMGIGSRVRIEAGGMRQTSWVRSGSSYCSANDLKAYFGMGSAARVDRMEVRWPNGETEIVRDIPVDRIVTVREGQGIQP